MVRERASSWQKAGCPRSECPCEISRKSSDRSGCSAGATGRSRRAWRSARARSGRRCGGRRPRGVGGARGGGRPGPERVGGTALSDGGGGAAGARLRTDPPRTPPRGSHARIAPPRVHGGASRWLRVHAVLRVLPAMAVPAESLDAADPPRRREDVRRLLRQKTVHLGYEDWRGDRGRAVRRGVGRLKLHVRRGDAHAARA
jgi:hypothetical protein